MYICMYATLDSNDKFITSATYNALSFLPNLNLWIYTQKSQPNSSKQSMQIHNLTPQAAIGHHTLSNKYIHAGSSTLASKR